MLGTNVPHPPSGDRNIDQLYDMGCMGIKRCIGM